MYKGFEKGPVVKLDLERVIRVQWEIFVAIIG
jgi:hypothetical protein